MTPGVSPGAQVGVGALPTGLGHTGGTGRSRAWVQKKPSCFFSCCCFHLAML